MGRGRLDGLSLRAKALRTRGRRWTARPYCGLAAISLFAERVMGVVCRPRFGRPCYDGCGAIVPTQRLNELAALAAMNGRSLRADERVCVECAKKRRGDASVTRKR